ncbi:hypothetical protein ABK040_010026 [Willaertia magna]
MGILLSIFGGKKESKVNEHDKAVLELKTQRDKIKMYQKKIQTVILKETDIARQLVKDGKKDKALLALKKKKYQETLLDKTQKQLDNLQKMVDEIEFAQIEKQVFEGLKQGKDALNSLQKEMGTLEDIEKLMEESREAIEYQEEISRIISQSLTNEELEDAEEDLNNLEAEMLKENLPAVKKEPLPKVTKPSEIEIEEEEETEEPIKV